MDDTNYRPTVDVNNPEDLDKCFTFLERLRLVGNVNMLGAAPNLTKAFGLEPTVATRVLSKWMLNYDSLSKRLGWEKE